MVCSHILGFPRMGAQRELKSALETYWKSASEPDDTNPDLEKLVEMGKQLRAAHWALQKKAGQDWVTVGDFAYYDHVLNHIQLLGCEPARFGFKKDTPELERYFAMARGSLTVESGQAMSMTKWFDTNYHYIVPEFFPETCFALSSERLFDEVKEAKALGYPVKAVLLGPVSFLYLGREKADGFDRLSLLPKLLPVYRQILSCLHAEGVEWIQIDEPVLGLDIEDKWLAAFRDVYQELSREPVKLLLTTYFSCRTYRYRLFVACCRIACRCYTGGGRPEGNRHQMAGRQNIVSRCDRWTQYLESGSGQGTGCSEITRVGRSPESVGGFELFPVACSVLAGC